MTDYWKCPNCNTLAPHNQSHVCGGCPPQKMKATYSTFLPAIPTAVVTLTCGKCDYQYIIMDRMSGGADWSYLAQADFCPRCGDGHKTNYAGAEVHE